MNAVRAARTFASHVATLDAADELAGRQEDAVRRAWHRLVSLLRQCHAPHDAGRAVRLAGYALDDLEKELDREIGRGVVRAAGHAYRQELLGSRPVTEQERRVAPRSERLKREAVEAARVAAQSARADRSKVAAVIHRGVTAGKSVEQIAKELQPLMDGVRSSARRAARDAVQEAAGQARFAAWDELGDMVVGYQVHAVIDSETRPDHRKRNGQVFYKRPKGRQKGLSEMPRPPREADGSMAFGCRCMMSAVFAPVTETRPKAGGTLDRGVTAAWFAKASEPQRKRAAGAKRYNAAKEVLGRKPEWRDITNAAGELLPLGQVVSGAVGRARRR